MRRNKVAAALCPLLCLVFAQAALPQPSVDLDFSGHAKYRFLANSYPEDSLYRALFGDSAIDHFVDTRWKFAADRERVDLQLDYQLQAVHGDRLQPGIAIDESLLAGPYPEDDRRIFDLTEVISNRGDTLVLHRLDRLHVGYTGEKAVLRAGRQVLSWGNGLIYNPVDFFNPFDPAALDTEYKSGDDMLYGQYLRDNGDDWQGVLVGRRNERGAIAADASSMAVKYHAWLDNWSGLSLLAGSEADLLLGEHYDDPVAAVGLVKSIGGAIWRSDLMFTRTAEGSVLSAVTNLSWSWVWRGMNVSGIAEYFYNGFGLDGNYSLAAVEREPELARRLERGELYTIGRHYLGLSATVELTPLWLLTPSLLVNLEDQSALLQLSNRYSLAQNWSLIGALNLPLGPEGSEYGGIDLRRDTESGTLGVEAGLFAQLAFYF